MVEFSEMSRLNIPSKSVMLPIPLFLFCTLAPITGLPVSSIIRPVTLRLSLFCAFFIGRYTVIRLFSTSYFKSVPANNIAKISRTVLFLASMETICLRLTSLFLTKNE